MSDSSATPVYEVVSPEGVPVDNKPAARGATGKSRARPRRPERLRETLYTCFFKDHVLSLLTLCAKKPLIVSGGRYEAQHRAGYSARMPDDPPVRFKVTQHDDCADISDEDRCPDRAGGSYGCSESGLVAGGR